MKRNLITVSCITEIMSNTYWFMCLVCVKNGVIDARYFAVEKKRQTDITRNNSK